MATQALSRRVQPAGPACPCTEPQVHNALFDLAVHQPFRALHRPRLLRPEQCQHSSRLCRVLCAECRLVCPEGCVIRPPRRYNRRENAAVGRPISCTRVSIMCLGAIVLFYKHHLHRCDSRKTAAPPSAESRVTGDRGDAPDAAREPRSAVRSASRRGSASGRVRVRTVCVCKYYVCAPILCAPSRRRRR